MRASILAGVAGPILKKVLTHELELEWLHEWDDAEALHRGIQAALTCSEVIAAEKIRPLRK